MKLLLKWLLSAAALLFVAYVYGGVQVQSFSSALIAAFVIGLFNAVLRPVLVVLTLPVLAVLASWFQWNAQSGQILGEMARTVLPDYAWTTLRLCVLVGLGVALVGGATAAAVTLFDFPGRKTFEWALLLPLAMPAYVVAYAYTDFLQFSGPLQVGLRNTFGLEGRLLPEVRSLGGAALVFTFTLYPYVYLLVRTALGERHAALMEAARRAFARHEPFAAECRHLRPDGSHQWVAVLGVVQDGVGRTGSGRPGSLLGTLQDITARKQAEAALRASEQRLAMALAGSRMGVWEWNVHETQLHFSAEVFDLLGMPSPGSGGKDLSVDQALQLVHPEDRALQRDVIANALASKGDFVVELPGGDIVVASPKWAGGAGAVTQIARANLSSGVITAANSLVGGAVGDKPGDHQRSRGAQVGGHHSRT